MGTEVKRSCVNPDESERTLSRLKFQPYMSSYGDHSVQTAYINALMRFNDAKRRLSKRKMPLVLKVEGPYGFFGRADFAMMFADELKVAGFKYEEPKK